MSAISRTLGVSRANLYTKRQSPGRGSYSRVDDARLTGLIRDIVGERPTYGYRRVTVALNRNLENTNSRRVNHKRVYRLMKQEGLLLVRFGVKQHRVHDGVIRTQNSDVRWCSDVFEISCKNGDTLRVLFSLDCCDREVISYLATTAGVSGEMVRDLMAESVERRFGSSARAPWVQWLSDNGPGYIADETRQFAFTVGLLPCTTPVHSPQSNGMAEAFVKTMKRDYVYFGDRTNARTVMEQLPKWMEHYNEHAPHKGLKMKSPREFRRLKLAS